MLEIETKAYYHASMPDSEHCHQYAYLDKGCLSEIVAAGNLAGSLALGLARSRTAILKLRIQLLCKTICLVQCNAATSSELDFGEACC